MFFYDNAKGSMSSVVKQLLQLALACCAAGRLSFLLLFLYSFDTSNIVICPSEIKAEEKREGYSKACLGVHLRSSLFI